MAPDAVPHQQVAVEAPVVIVGGPAVMGLAGLQRPADTHEECGGVLPHPEILPLLGGQVRPAVLQLLTGDEGHLPVQRGQGSQLGEYRAQGGLGVRQGSHDGGDGGLQIVRVAVPGGDDLLPVPLVHVDRVNVVQLLVPADGVHVGVQPLPHRELVAIEGHALPLGQRVDHLGLPPGEGDVKGDGALHAVQVVIQAGGCLHKQGRRHPAQTQGTPQIVLKQPLEQADGLLGIIQVQAGGIPRRDDGDGHTLFSFAVVIMHYTPPGEKMQERTSKIAKSTPVPPIRRSGTAPPDWPECPPRCPCPRRRRTPAGRGNCTRRCPDSGRAAPRRTGARHRCRRGWAPPWE